MLRKILVIGAGKSTSYLLDYFLDKSKEEQLQIIIADLDPENIPIRFKEHTSFKIVALDIFNTQERQNAVKNAAIY